MSFFKKPLKSDTTSSLKFHLHQYLSRYEEARPLKKVHASNLTKEGGLCPRYYALADKTGKKPKDEWLTASEQVTFHIGRVLQDSVVNWFADMGKAICHWRCVSCKQLHEFQHRPLKCVSCGTKSFTPEEVRFESAVSGASCGVDMLVSMGETKLRPIEIKTMDKDQFKTLLAPLAEHRLRTNFYLRLIGESGHSWSNLVNDQVATVLYISKGGYGCADPVLKTCGLNDQFSPFKEYTVKRNDSETEGITARAKVVKDFRDGAQGMPKGVCASSLDKRAVYCPYKAACFGGDFPPTYDWQSK